MYSGPCQTSYMQSFEKIVNGYFNSYFHKRPIFDVWQCSEYVSENKDIQIQNA